MENTVRNTLKPKDLGITTTEDAQNQDHRDDSKPRMVHTYDEADDAREWKRENAETVEVIKNLKHKTLQITKELNQMGGSLSCFSRGACGKHARKRRDYSDDEDSDDGETEKLVCNMTGQGWEASPFPVVVDSGASASVMPQEWCPVVPIVSTPQSEQGEFFTAGGGWNSTIRGTFTLTKD